MEKKEYPKEYWDKWRLSFNQYFGSKVFCGHITHEEAARLSGAKESDVRYWGLGYLKPTDEQVQKLSEATGDPGYLESWQCQNRNTIRAWDAITGQELTVEVI